MEANQFFFNLIYSTSYLQPLIPWLFAWQHYLSVCVFVSPEQIKSCSLTLFRILGTISVILLYVFVVIARTEQEISTFVAKFLD